MGLSTSIQKGIWLKIRLPMQRFQRYGHPPPYFVIGLLTLSVGKRLCISVGFELGDKILAHSLANVEMISVHKMKIFTWM
jgi:hypothetical protein